MGRVIVIGGGVIGLLSARMLAQAGLDVLVLEQGSVGREASWAGGGIVSPLYPWRYTPAVTALARQSQQFYPLLAEQLFAETGIDPQLSATGLYWLDLEDEVCAIEWARRERVALESISISAVRSRVPAIGERFSHALYMPDIANVRNPKLMQSLHASLSLIPNVEVREGCSATGLIHDGGRILGATVGSEEFHADYTVLAAGAWSGELISSLGFSLPVEPVKGQMLLYRTAKDFLSSMLLAEGRYAIPRRDGHILVGSTLEHVGFDKAPTDDARFSLRRSAEKLLPALAKVDPIMQWAGLRPGSPEGIPFIGPVPGYDGLWLNCGHYRNGLVMAPASCRLLIEMMLSRSSTIDSAPYLPAARLI